MKCSRVSHGVVVIVEVVAIDGATAKGMTRSQLRGLSF
jgi:hypothetical protein